MNYKWIPICFLAFMLTGCSEGCSDKAKQATKTITEKTVRTTKKAIAGIKEGAKEGRKTGDSLDGAVLMSTAKELEGKAELSIEEIKKTNDGEFKLILVVYNKLKTPLRITGFGEKAGMVLLDVEGFAASLTSEYLNRDEITVLPEAKQRFKFTFKGDIKSPSKLRILGKEIEIKNVGHETLVKE